MRLVKAGTRSENTAVRKLGAVYAQAKAPRAAAAREEALRKLVEEAQALGADEIVDVVNSCRDDGDVVHVLAAGNAVMLEPVPAPEELTT